LGKEGGDMTEKRPLQAELKSLRTEAQALKEQMARYAVHPPMATDHPHIVRIEGVQSGEPMIRSAYVTVRGIVELTRLGQTPERIVAEHSPRLSLAQVHDALSYYYDHPAEIENYIREHREALKRATKLSREIAGQRKRGKSTARAKGAAHARR
jgi:uncharacterized protein (DUF433 family)